MASRNNFLPKEEILRLGHRLHRIGREQLRLNHTELAHYAHRCGMDLTEAQVESLLRSCCLLYTSYTAFATVGGNAVGVVATGKNLCHNCVAKASRFVRLCDAFSVPVITIVDTEGFVPSATDDIAGGILSLIHI